MMRTLMLFALVGCADLVAGEPMRITGAEFRGAKQPQIAVSAEGKVFVAFGRGEDIYVTRSLDGSQFEPPAKAGAPDKLALGMRRGPRIALAGKDVVVTAISHSTGNLYGWVSRDEGSSWSKASIINTVSNAAREGLQALAGDGRGRLISVWLDLRNGKTELWSSVSNDGGERWNANLRVYQSPAGTICECCHPSAIFSDDGKIVVMWRNWMNGERDMYRAESVDSGKTFSGAKKIGSGSWKLPACPMDGGSLEIANGTIRYAWRREAKLFYTSDEASEELLSGSGTQPVIVQNAKGFSYFWQDNGNLYWRSSERAAPEMFARNGGYAACAWSEKDQKIFVVWESSDGIYLSEVKAK